MQGSAVRGGVVQAYAGPERPPQEVGTIALANSQIFVEVVGVDGEAVGDARAIRVLPGESRIEVRCVRWQPRDPFGSWRGREVLQVEIEAGGHYRLSTWTTGAGRADSRPNRCTSRVEESGSRLVVSSVVEVLE